MRRILVLGAGHSSPFLIRYLLRWAPDHDWRVRVVDRDPELAARRVDGHPLGEAARLDAASADALGREVEGADLVVDLLPPSFQRVLTHECLRHRRSLVSVSYAEPATRALSSEAVRRGVLLLFEMGLDPGIDHMATMALVERLASRGAEVESFLSYGAGLPAPDSIANPLCYAITWNPMNVVMAGEGGALFLRDGRLRALPRERLFTATWPVEIEGVGTLEAYANRDSLAYRDLFGLRSARTVVRGTLRYPGWCAVWNAVIRLGLPTRGLSVPDLADLTFAELVELFLPADGSGATVEERAGRFLGLRRDDPVFDNLRWLGLFSDERIGCRGSSPADALVELLSRRLTLPAGGRDLVILRHEVVAREADGARRTRVLSTLLELGKPRGFSAMARTVGLPAGIAARLISTDRLELAGCHLPVEPAVYRPVLEELAREGLEIEESETELAPAAA
ncbi:MAG: saccharopine dehydrogenase C-terminal domain-containing protein [Thermoanaerobaculia bacterium]|nr:saccharopine dehydrogenase C-terminal domain-containing protein [Thermoanaerobaculia bacterium]